MYKIYMETINATEDGKESFIYLYFFLLGKTSSLSPANIQISGPEQNNQTTCENFLNLSPEQ